MGGRHWVGKRASYLAAALAVVLLLGACVGAGVRVNGEDVVFEPAPPCSETGTCAEAHVDTEGEERCDGYPVEVCHTSAIQFCVGECTTGLDEGGESSFHVCVLGLLCAAGNMKAVTDCDTSGLPCHVDLELCAEGVCLPPLVS